MREALQKLGPLCDELFPAENERIVKLLVQEVVVSRDVLLICLRLNGLNALVAELQGTGSAEVGMDGHTTEVAVEPPALAGVGSDVPLAADDRFR